MSSFNFSIDGLDDQARAGTIQTKNGKIKTPVFMPVGTLGSVKAVFPSSLLKLKIDIILANTYHLMLRPGEDLIEKMGGLHNFINWKKPILTDSGGFQIMSLSKLSKIDKNIGAIFSSHIDGKKIILSPEKSIQIQKKN